MLKKLNRLRFRRKKAELKLSEAEISKMASKIASKTAGESIRDATIKMGMEAAYQAGNNTDRIIGVADKIGRGVDGGAVLFGGCESSGALGRIVFKTTKDFVSGDKICTGLCLISATCETLALSCSTIKIIPYRGRIYIGCKIVSRGCMSWRNACARDGC